MTTTKTHTAPRGARQARTLIAALVLGAAMASHAADGLRPEVGKPLQAAQDLIKAQKYKEALNKVRDADAVSGKTAQESFTIDRMRLAAASGAGDLATATAAYDALDKSGKLAQAEKLRYIESLAGTAYRAQNYASVNQWGQRYHKEGGNSPTIRTLIVQAQYLSGDYAGAAKALTTDVQAAEKAGGPPPETSLKLLLTTASKLDDTDKYVYAVEKLLTYYPKKEYWGDLLTRLQRKPNFSEKFALDTYRLALATGSLRNANDYIEMAQLAAQAGFPAEGKQVLEKGYAAGILGTGPGADRQARLRDLLNKRSNEDKAARPTAEAQALAAADGNALVKLGFNLALSGESAKGLSLMQQGLSKGGLAAAETSKLRYGIAQVLTGNTSQGHATLRSVTGNDGAAELARLWSLYARSKPSNAA
ncbi:MAG TPA: hypothetical protein H9903_18175 [Candidatus Aquabacterium excrementipullorum]|nr:hypothetical protein [Candidatus Aquabacterium excrementipullorum]